MPAGTASGDTDSLGFDPGVPHIARIYDYWLGGKDNFAADREAAELAVAANPTVRVGVRANRAFLRRAVRYLAAERGIRQFLDIGTGIPTSGNTHEVAQLVAPDARIVYVDNDPIVLVHARALLTSSAEGSTDYLHADLRDPDAILAGAARTLDFGQPVAVLLMMILHMIPDSAQPWQIVDRLTAALAPGSFVALSHPASDVQQEAMAGLATRLNESMPGTPLTLRTRGQIGDFLAGLELVEPGVVQLHRWRPDPADAEYADDLAAYCGVARKPAT